MVVVAGLEGGLELCAGGESAGLEARVDFLLEGGEPCFGVGANDEVA